MLYINDLINWGDDMMLNNCMDTAGTCTVKTCDVLDTELRIWSLILKIIEIHNLLQILKVLITKNLQKLIVTNFKKKRG